MANMNGMLICYGWINIPLVYTQVRKASIVRRASSPSGRHAGGVRILCGLPLWSPGEILYERHLLTLTQLFQYLLPTQYKVEENSYVPVRILGFYYFLPHRFYFKVAHFPTIANWTGTRVPGVDNVIGYDNDVSFGSFL